MRRLLLTFVIFAVSTGCALRPRYRDFVTDTTLGPDAKLVLFEKDSDKKLAGVKLEMSEWKNKVIVTTGPDGAFALPVEKKYLDENPVLVVTLPAGVMGYEIVAAPLTLAPATVGAGPSVAPAPVAIPPANK